MEPPLDLMDEVDARRLDEQEEVILTRLHRFRDGKKLLESPRNASRYYVLSALRTAGDPAAIPYVRPMLEVADAQVSANAATTLAAFGDRESFDAIAAVLPLKFKRDDFAQVRDLLHALHALDPNRARPLIERVANDPAFANRRDHLVPK